jgi:transposase InsO family protein
MAVLAHIREQYSLSLGSYGSPRMTMELKEAGLVVGERRVGRLMRMNGIKPVRTRRHKVTTDSNHRLGVAANWLDGDFVADAPNRKWAGNITYVWTAEGWLYLAVILDLHSRRVVGWPFDTLRGQRQDEEGSGDSGTRYGCTPPQPSAGLPVPLRSWQPILLL